jgi:hypothetical protein
MFIEPIASPKALLVIWSGHGFKVECVEDGWLKCIGQKVRERHVRNS